MASRWGGAARLTEGPEFQSREGRESESTAFHPAFAREFNIEAIVKYEKVRAANPARYRAQVKVCINDIPAIAPH